MTAQTQLPSGEDIARRALEYLATHHCMSLATDGPEGLWASTVFYVNEGFELGFLSRSDTRHVRNLEASPHVAVTISDDVADWLGVSGVQLEGTAERVGDAHRLEVLTAFRRRYAFADNLWWSAAPAAGSEQRVYRIHPSRLWFVDHRFLDTRSEIPPELLHA